MARELKKTKNAGGWVSLLGFPHDPRNACSVPFGALRTLHSGQWGRVSSLPSRNRGLLVRGKVSKRRWPGREAETVLGRMVRAPQYLGNCKR